MHSDLLPTSVVNRRLLVPRMKFWCCIWLIAGVAIIGLCVHRGRSLTALKLESALLNAQAKPLRHVQAQQKKMRAEVQRIRDRESLLTESDSSQTLQLVGIVSQAAQRNDGRISVQSFRLTSIETEIAPLKPLPRKSRKKPKIIKQTQLELDGIAVNDVAVASFVAMLRESGVFESVELKSTLRAVVNDHETRQYRVACVY